MVPQRARRCAPTMSGESGISDHSKRARFVLAAAALLLLAALAHGAAARAADEELNPDRPDFTDSAVTAPVGHPWLETGLLRQRDAGATEDDLGQALLRWGLRPGLEVRLGLGSWVRLREQGSAGWDGGSLGAKLRLREPHGQWP